MGRRTKTKKCIVFDESSRREFVTGFHKRKLERKKKFEEKFEQQLKEAKRQIKAKARETLNEIIRSYEPSHHVPALFEKHYELPNHTVKVRELLSEDIANENNWIGENKMCLKDTDNFDYEIQKPESAHRDELIPGMSMSSIKDVKKAVSKQSTAMARCDKIFRRKNKLERIKNKKKAAKKKRLLEKEQGKHKKKKR